MKLMSLQSLIAFLCISGSLTMASRELAAVDQSTIAPRGHRSVRPQKSARSLLVGAPTNELEAQLYFYMQPTAQKVNHRDRYDAY